MANGAGCRIINIQRMGEGGHEGDAVHHVKKRFPGLRRIGLGLLYVAAGVGFWQLR